MTVQELEQAIRDIIRNVYCSEYCGRLILKIKEDCGIKSYNLILGLNNVDKPLVISCQGHDAFFLKYVEKELRSRHLDFVSFFMGYQIVKEHGENEECNKN